VLHALIAVSWRRLLSGSGGALLQEPHIDSGSIGSHDFCAVVRPGDHDGGALLLRTQLSRTFAPGNRYGRPRRLTCRPSEALMQRRCRAATIGPCSGREKGRPRLAGHSRPHARFPGAGISESDEKIILSYLLSEDSINSRARSELVIGKALVDSHCNRCHALDRTYQTVKTAPSGTAR